jgi:hypothetical protein
MKNKQIKDSWSKIQPSSAADERMLGAILEYNHSLYGDKAFGNRAFIKKRLSLIAACLMVVIALTAVICNNHNLLGIGVHTEESGTSGGLNYYKSGAVTKESDMSWGVATQGRKLTNNENMILFKDLVGVTANGIFNTNSKSLLHVFGKFGKTTILFSAPGLPLTDTIIVADEKLSEINGIPISAGYFITKANSKGIKNIIYFASFTLNDVSVFVKCGGAKYEKDNLRGEITRVIVQLVNNSAPDFSKITF